MFRTSVLRRSVGQVFVDGSFGEGGACSTGPARTLQTGVVALLWQPPVSRRIRISVRTVPSTGNQTCCNRGQFAHTRIGRTESLNWQER